jgi:hypothetical protein
MDLASQALIVDVAHSLLSPFGAKMIGARASVHKDHE